MISASSEQPQLLELMFEKMLAAEPGMKQAALASLTRRV